MTVPRLAVRREVMPATQDEWLGLRLNRITSSVAAACLGADPHCTPLQAWAKITGRDVFAGNNATVRGTLLEPVVLDYPTHGGELTRQQAPFVEWGWRGDSVDCLYRAAGVTLCGEGKTVAQGGASEWGPDGTDQVPDKVVVQSLWHLAHWPQADACIVPVLIGGFAFEFRTYRVPRNDEAIGIILEDCAQFWRDYVKTDKPPPASAGDDESLRHLYPRHVPGQWLEPTDELADSAAVYAAARGALKIAEQVKSEAGARLKQLIGNAEGFRSDDLKVTWKYQNGRATTDWAAIARELAGGEVDDDTIQRHTRFSNAARVLRVVEVKP